MKSLGQKAGQWLPWARCGLGDWVTDDMAELFEAIEMVNIFIIMGTPSTYTFVKIHVYFLILKNYEF